MAYFSLFWGYFCRVYTKSIRIKSLFTSTLYNVSLYYVFVVGFSVDNLWILWICTVYFDRFFLMCVFLTGKMLLCNVDRKISVFDLLPIIYGVVTSTYTIDEGGII